MGAVKTWYTTGQAAKVLRVSARTVCKYCDKGSLRCARLPPWSGRGRFGDRRIEAGDLRAFCRAHGLPCRLPGDPADRPTLVYIGNVQPGEAPPYAAAAPDWFAAGRLVEALQPRVVVANLGGVDGAYWVSQLAHAMRADANLHDTYLVAVPGDDQATNYTLHARLVRAGFDLVSPPPWRWEPLHPEVAKRVL